MIQEYEVRDQLISLLSGDVSLDDFEDWLTTSSWNMHQHSPRAAQELVGDIELALFEYSNGLLDEDQLRMRLLSLAGNIYVPIPEHPSRPSVISGTTSYQVVGDLIALPV